VAAVGKPLIGSRYAVYQYPPPPVGYPRAEGDFPRGETLLMHDPPHPGEVIRKLCLEPLALTVSEAAKALNVSRKTLSAILNGHAGISPEMAVRLSIAFDTTAESWLNQQVQYDLWRVEGRRSKLRVSRLSVA